MKETVASVFAICECISIAWCETSQGPGQRNRDCQQRSTSGRDYIGEINTTVDGIPCQKWSDTQPHDHDFTDVGDHLTSVEILMEILRYGVTPQIQTLSGKTAQFRSAPL